VPSLLGKLNFADIQPRKGTGGFDALKKRANMRSRYYFLQRGAVALTAPALAFGLLTAATRHSVSALMLTLGWCALVWLTYALLRR
jgi:hypothetical protein